MSTAVTEITRAEVAEAEIVEARTDEPDALDSRRSAVSWGRLAVFLLIAQALSGLVLMFYYRPTIGSAYLDLVDLREVSRLGFLRTLHRWSSHAIVILIWVHLLRVALRAAYARQQRRTWIGGIALMLLTLLLAATGHFLPRDQEAFWSLGAMAPVVSDAARGEGVLLRFYLAHCVVLPLVVAGLSVDHLRRARRARRGPESGSDTRA